MFIAPVENSECLYAVRSCCLDEWLGTLEQIFLANILRRMGGAGYNPGVLGDVHKEISKYCLSL